MKFIFQILLYTLFLAVSSYKAKTQNIVEDFKKINEAYSNHSDISMVVEYKVFKNAEIQEAIQVEKGELLKKGNKIYNKIAEMEMLSTADYQITVDHANKFVFITNGEASSRKDVSAVVIQIQKLLKTCTKTEFLKINDVSEGYAITIPSSEYKSIEVIYNKKTFLIEKFTFFYREEQSLLEESNEIKETPRMEIVYSKINTKSNIPEEKFSYSNYLNLENSKFALNSNYKEYQFINKIRN